MKEQGIQASILKAISVYGARGFRINSGKFWGGKVLSHQGNKLLLENPTHIEGAAAGTSDLFAIKTVVVTPEMIGQTLGIFCCLEVKQPGENPRENQINFLKMMRQRGAIVGVPRSVEDAIRILGRV